MLSLMSYPCASRKCLTHKTKYIASFTPTTSASVELLVFIFCFVLMDIGHPLPIGIVAPVWLRMFGCTAYEASIHQLITLLPSASNVNLSSLVSRRNRRQRPIFFPSSSSGSCTLVHKNEMARSKSGLVRLPRYNNCAVKWWNKIAEAGSSLSQLSFTANRWQWWSRQNTASVDCVRPRQSHTILPSSLADTEPSYNRSREHMLIRC